MLSGGDEVARSQRGNNNGYCQDNELTWYDWNLDEPRKRLMEFTASLIKLRLAHPNLHRRSFFQDRTINGSVVRDIAWFNTDGSEYPDEQWNQTWNRSIGMMLNGNTLAITDEEGHPVKDASFLFLINAFHEGVEFTLPPTPAGTNWCHVIDTENIENPFADVPVNDKVIVGGRSLMLFSDAPYYDSSKAQNA